MKTHITRTNTGGFNGIFLLIMLIGNMFSLFCQDYDYKLSLNQKDIHYRVKWGTKEFVVYNKQRQKISSGSYAELVKGDMFFGQLSKYRDESVLDLPAGSIINSYYFKCVNGELNGLHFIGGYDYDINKSKSIYNPKADYVAVINNHLVGSSFKNTNRRPDRKANAESKFALDYLLAQQLGREIFNIYTEEYLNLKNMELHEEDMYYDLELMTGIFLEDFVAHIDDFSKRLKLDSNSSLIDNPDIVVKQLKSVKKLLAEPKAVYSTFEKLEQGTIAISLGKNNNDNIIIKVDPDSWLAANPATRWYILYHELGHDVLNLNHGQGGRMMFNYPTKQYSWDDFFKDRKKMFIHIIKKIFPEYDELFGSYGY